MENTVYLIAPDERVIYPFTLEGTANLIVARRVPHQVQQLVRRYFASLAPEDLSPVYRLLQSAVDRQVEPIRAFISAWTALEIFINKTFGTYEDMWFKEASKNRGKIELSHVKRIRQVMRDKYRMEDRFALVSMMLDEVNCDQDLVIFSEVKKERDELLHRGSDYRKQFRTADAVALVRKYLKKHLDEMST